MSALKFSFGLPSVDIKKGSRGPHERVFGYPSDYRLDREALASDSVNLNLGWIYSAAWHLRSQTSTFSTLAFAVLSLTQKISKGSEKKRSKL